MKTKLILLAITATLILGVVAATNITVQVILTPDDVRAIQASILRQNNPAITNVTQHIQNIVDIDTAQRKAELRGTEIEPIRERWESLSAAQRRAVLDAAGAP